MDLFWQFLRTPWAPRIGDIAVSCLAPPPGLPPDPGGIVDPATVSAALLVAFWLSVIAVVVLVISCYVGTNVSTGPSFSKRWLGFGALCGSVCSAIGLLTLRFWPIRAYPGSCETNPEAFPVVLPWSLMIIRGVAGLLLAIVMYLLLSLILTRSIGHYAWTKGFFHNRGVPWPRLLRPGSKS